MASYRQVMVDGSPVGIQGLDEIFASLKAEAIMPQDECLSHVLLERVEKANYVPYGAREIYAAALSREYAAYIASEDASGSGHKKPYPSWHGTPREQIPWYPTIDEDLCNGCGACLRMCKTGTLVPTDDGKARVSEPFACVVGCSSCANLCKPGAILFPPRSMLETYGQTSRHARRALFGRG